MSKKPYIDVFIKLIYPEMTELTMATLSEEDCIEDATTLIENQAKRIKELEGDKEHPEHYCHICGGKNITWYADNELWNQVVDDIGLICCPLCFIKLAEQKGIKPTAWRLSRECDEPEVDKLRLEIVGQIERIKELEEEVHTLREREYCDDCSAKTILPEPHGIGCKAKKRIKELEAENQKLIEGQKAKIEAGS